jgi:hypothetical protein
MNTLDANTHRRRQIILGIAITTAIGLFNLLLAKYGLPTIPAEWAAPLSAESSSTPPSTGSQKNSSNASDESSASNVTPGALAARSRLRDALDKRRTARKQRQQPAPIPAPPQQKTPRTASIPHEELIEPPTPKDA